VLRFARARLTGVEFTGAKAEGRGVLPHWDAPILSLLHKEHHGMTDDKKKAERHFNWQAIKESVERMKPELIAASEAAHKAKHAASDEDDPGYADFDRTVELGYLVECLGGLCAPHLMLLNEIAEALHELHDAEGEHGQETPHHQH
jgi:hypothetical protein